MEPARARQETGVTVHSKKTVQDASIYRPSTGRDHVRAPEETGLASTFGGLTHFRCRPTPLGLQVNNRICMVSGWKAGPGIT